MRTSLHCGEINHVGAVGGAVGIGSMCGLTGSILSLPFLFPRSFPSSSTIGHFHANAAPFISGIALFAPTSPPCSVVASSRGSDGVLPTDSITRHWREKAGCRLKLAAGAFIGSKYRWILIGDSSPVLVSC